MLDSTSLEGLEQVRALQRSLLAAAFNPDPGLLQRDPAAFAAAQGLPGRDQAAFRRFRERLLNYRDMVRSGLTEPIEDMFPITRALLAKAGAWQGCLAAFLQARAINSPFYRDIAPTFLGWLADTGWGQERWPFLLQLAHCECLHTLVGHHPGGPAQKDLHREPELGDLLALDPAAQLLAYDFRVHRAKPEQPVPATAEVRLLVHRDREGRVHWAELTPATAALLVDGQTRPIGEVALGLGLPSGAEVLGLLGTFRDQGAILGFRSPEGFR